MEVSATEEAGKRQRPAVVSLVHTARAEKEKTRIVAEVILKGPKGERKAKALMDTGAEANCIRRHLAVDMELGTVGKTPTSLITPSNGSITTYANHQISVTAIDTYGGRRDSEELFVSCDFDMGDIEIILGLPWFQRIDPCVSFSTMSWRHRVEEDTKLEILPAKQFWKKAKNEPYMFALLRIPTTDGLRIAAMDTEASVQNPQTIPSEYADYADVFSTQSASLLPEHHAMEHRIDLEAGTQPPYGPIYALSEKELEVLREYLEAAEAKGWIRRSTSAAGAPIMFVPKKGGGLRLCVDYRGLNRITIKNRTPLPLISETMDRLRRAQVFTKLDLKDAYHRIRIRSGDEWKTAFRTRYGHFEYCVMPFGLSNAPATFQAYINQALVGLVDVTCVVYLDDILIYSEDPDSHPTAVRQVLERLQQYSLFANIQKCEFNTRSVEFLGFVISPDGVTMERSRIHDICKWEEPRSVRDVQVFLGFANFYRRFIHRYAKKVKPLTDLLRNADSPFKWSKEAGQAFAMLKAAFTTAPILRHFDPLLKTRVETDASGFAVAGILSQLFMNGACARWHPIAFYSKKMSDTETRYETHDAELLAIILAFRTWRHYLAYSQDTVVVKTDHNNLKYFMTKRKLNGRQVRWAEELSAFDFEMEWRAGSLNPADGPSRMPEYRRQAEAAPDDVNDDILSSVLAEKLQNVSKSPQLVAAFRWRTQGDVPTCVQQGRELSRTKLGFGSSTQRGELKTRCRNEGLLSLLEPVADAAGCKQYVSRVLAVVAVGSETAYDQSGETLEELLEIRQRSDPFVQSKRYESLPKPRDAGVNPFWKVAANGLLLRGNAVYVPEDQALKAELLRANHDDPLGGHFGVSKTLEIMRRKYFWQAMRRDVREYVKTCAICQRTKVKRHLPYGALASFPIPEGPWQELTLDFITGLPPSKHLNKVYDSILVVVDRYTKMARYIPCTKDIDTPEMAELFVQRIVKDFGVPKGLTSDRGPQFTSSFWSTLCFMLKIRRRLSTAFHPQTDGQTENLNQTLEQYLRSYCCYQQDDWAPKLALAEFTYNNSFHTTINTSPFFATYGFHPTVELNVEDNVPEREAPIAIERAKLISADRIQLEKRWQHAVEQQKKHYDHKHIPKSFKIGDQVMLQAKNIRQLRPSKKLADRYLGPFEIMEVVGSHRQAYKLKLPPAYRIHNVFHISLLEPWHSREGAVEPPPSIEIDGDLEYEVESIQAHRNSQKGREYLVRWKGYTPAEDTWEVARNLKNAQEKVRMYLQRQPGETSAHKRRRKN
jgi:transposase InsO family protein